MHFSKLTLAVILYLSASAVSSPIPDDKADTVAKIKNKLFGAAQDHDRGSNAVNPKLDSKLHHPHPRPSKAELSTLFNYVQRRETDLSKRGNRDQKSKLFQAWAKWIDADSDRNGNNMVSKEKGVAANDEPTPNQKHQKGKGHLKVVADPMLEHFMKNGIVAGDGDTIMRVNVYFNGRKEFLDHAADETGNKAFRNQSKKFFQTHLDWSNKQNYELCPGRCS